ncbi:MAG: hypothetical protein AAGC93_26310, partial [Cyanobacteria bacterium P01_F01_bin.53]
MSVSLTMLSHQYFDNLFPGICVKDVLAETSSEKTIRKLNRAQFKKSLKSICRDRKILAEISKNSCLHPNGFYRLVLWEGLRGERIRLHLWPADSVCVDSDIHNHFWRFSSLVLFGKVRSETFVPGDEFTEATSYRHF